MGLVLSQIGNKSSKKSKKERSSNNVSISENNYFQSD